MSLSNEDVRMTGTAKWIIFLGKIKLFTNLGCFIYPLMTVILVGIPLVGAMKVILSLNIG
jgi:hypothetical protein